MKATSTGSGRIAIVIPVVLLILVLIWVIVARSGGSDTAQPSSEQNSDTTVPQVLPDELVEIDAGHSIDDDHDHHTFDIEDTDHLESMEQLATSLRTFEEGYRSVFPGDTYEAKLARVAGVVRADVIPYLDLEPDMFVSDMTYSIEASVDEPEAVLSGLLLHIATGEISLAIDVTYTRVDANGDKVEQGTLLTRSQWERIDGQWLLVGADY